MNLNNLRRYNNGTWVDITVIRLAYTGEDDEVLDLIFKYLRGSYAYFT